MILEGPIRQVEIAQAEFRSVADNATGWSDQQRHTFDSQRIRPLVSAGTQLLSALRKAQEQCAAAERLLSGG
jgi:hypothetical protein